MTPKFCKDCAFYHPSDLTDEKDNLDKCTQVWEIDLVRGGPKAKIQYCEYRRRYDCGPDGKFWQARS